MLLYLDKLAKIIRFIVRSLVTIREIDAVQPIEKTDFVETVIIGGWKIVVKISDNFKAGDLVVYGEIDSIFPVDNPKFTFLEGKPLKTKRMRGVISQGIVFPLSILPKGDYQKGQDVTELLGVTKYKPPLPTNTQAKGQFPLFIPKTDLERVQNLSNDIKEYCDTKYFFGIQEKLDGTSITIYYDYLNQESGICTLDFDLHLTWDNIYTLAGRPILKQLIKYCKEQCRSIALQGKLIGEKIQGNKYNIEGQKIYFFQAYDIDDKKYLDNVEFHLLLKKLNLISVPCLNPVSSLVTIDKWLEFTQGKSKLNPKVERKGIVARTFANDFCFSIINNNFLLKEK
jgi:RNA ligase (TIGR02306 family)